MMEAYTGHTGPVTMTAVMDQIPQELKQRLTYRELGLVMSAVNNAYHNGRKSVGIETCDDCVWMDDKLIPFTALRSIKIEPGDRGAKNYTLAYAEPSPY